MISAFALSSPAVQAADGFSYANEKFADIQMLRYKVEGFEQLTLQQKTLIYYLSEAALYGRDILFDQNGAYNLRIRKMQDKENERIPPAPLNSLNSKESIIQNVAYKKYNVKYN